MRIPTPPGDVTEPLPILFSCLQCWDNAKAGNILKMAYAANNHRIVATANGYGIGWLPMYAALALMWMSYDELFWSTYTEDSQTLKLRDAITKWRV